MTCLKIGSADTKTSVRFLFLYPLKTSENQRFSDVFRGIEKENHCSV